MEIQLDGNKAIGIDNFMIGDYLPIDFNFKKGTKNWICEDVGVDIDDTRKISFLEYYYGCDKKLKYKKYVLLKNSLKKDISELIKYSFCYIDCDTYYFPMINLVIWTNKDVKFHGYSIGIYQYGYYDKCCEDDKDIINGKCDYKIGEMIYKK
jgi:hypothetical protein